ncbi:hypothetical protein FBUS_01414 [Fasciolopsis buskii]|uniref:G-protein coupled receptors family 1 profile domain-containing protein n=1 Tax=Fasciolopsis buskii TaxID=27845 RepID=A0A8E0VH94_9TREM|nr:hypothetical protein FBUS_01414 [Fasciolopsis buski]
MSAKVIIRCFIGVVGAIGTITNIVAFVLLIRHRFASKLTNLFFRGQCIYDGFACFIMFLRQLFPNEVHTNSAGFDLFVCMLWSQDNLFWLGAILAASNLVCITLDRLIAVFKPLLYRRKQKLLTIVFTSYNIFNVLILFTPQLARRKLVNGTCTFEFVSVHGPLNILGSVQAYMLVVFTYMLPCLCTIISHALIIWKILQIKNFCPESSGTSQTTSSSSNCTDRCEEGMYTAAVRRLVITTVVLSALYITCGSLEAFTYAFGTSGLIDYMENSVRQQLGLGLMVLRGCISPLVIVSSMMRPRSSDFTKKLKMYLQSHLSMERFHRGVGRAQSVNR